MSETQEDADYATEVLHYENATVYFDARDSGEDSWAEKYEGELRVHPSGFVDCVEIDQLIPQWHVDTINYGP